MCACTLLEAQLEAAANCHQALQQPVVEKLTMLDRRRAGRALREDNPLALERRLDALATEAAAAASERDRLLQCAPAASVRKLRVSALWVGGEGQGRRLSES